MLGRRHSIRRGKPVRGGDAGSAGPGGQLPDWARFRHQAKDGASKRKSNDKKGVGRPHGGGQRSSEDTTESDANKPRDAWEDYGSLFFWEKQAWELR